jgi:hypothetical protein
VLALLRNAHINRGETPNQEINEKTQYTAYTLSHRGGINDEGKNIPNQSLLQARLTVMDNRLNGTAQTEIPNILSSSTQNRFHKRANSQLLTGYRKRIDSCI